MVQDELIQNNSSILAASTWPRGMNTQRQLHICNHAGVSDIYEYLSMTRRRLHLQIREAKYQIYPSVEQTARRSMRINRIIFFFLFSQKNGSFYPALFTIWSQRSGSRNHTPSCVVACRELTNDEKIDKITSH